MAFRMDSKTPFGITVQNSYVKIKTIGGTKETVTLELLHYVNKDYGDNEDEPFARSYYSLSPSVSDGSENFFKQGYEYLKTLPDFSTAIDVLE